MVKIRSSPQRRKKFAFQAEAAGLKGLNLILDVRTRWNSTHDMLERALKMREVRNTILILITDYYYYYFNMLLLHYRH